MKIQNPVLFVALLSAVTSFADNAAVLPQGVLKKK